jgi:hypothetical protein
MGSISLHVPLFSPAQPSDYSLDDLVDICIEAAPMAEHNSLRLP